MVGGGKEGWKWVNRKGGRVLGSHCMSGIAMKRRAEGGEG